MMRNLANPYPHAEELVDHWWWRPGWSPDTHWYAWHFTLEHQPALHRIAADYQESLRRFDYLDLIPQEWLHLTVQGIGNVDSVSDGDREYIIEAVSQRLSQVPAPELTFVRPVLHREAVVMPPSDLEPLRRVRREIRQGIADVWGSENVPESDAYRPHFSLAYVNRPQPVSEVLTATERVSSEPAFATLRSASLINLRREHRCYMWSTVAVVDLGVQH